MARTWRMLPNGKIHAMDDNTGKYACGVGFEPGIDKILPKKPRKGNFCGNCLRVINKKK